MSNFLRSYVGAGAQRTPKPRVRGNRNNSAKKDDDDDDSTPGSNRFVKTTSDTLIAPVMVRGKKQKEIHVPRFNKMESAFMRKSTVLYGTSGSGKTYLIRDIMYILRNKFARVWVFCPTNAQNNMYTGLVPNPLIRDTVTLKDIQDIYEFQKAARAIYETANEMQTLRRLFMRIPNAHKARMFEHKLIELETEAMRKMEMEFPDPVVRESKADRIREIMTDKLRQHYKRIIGIHAEKLACLELTDEERYAIKFLGFSPDSLVIFDDAMMEVDHIVKKGKKEENPVVQNFFFKGRHIFLTTIYAMQSDKMFDPDLRKNAFNSIFTSEDEAFGFFSKAANGISGDQQKDAKAAISEIFAEKNKKKFAKLIYLKDSSSKYQYICADPHTRFPMCGDAVRKFCRVIEERSKTIDKDSKFAKKFAAYAGTNKGGSAPF